MASATRSAAAAALLLLASTYVLTLGQESATTVSTTIDVTSTTTVKGPRTNVELTTSTSTADTTGDDALRGGPVSSAVGAAATRVTGAISGAIDAAHAAIGERLRAAGVTPEVFASWSDPLLASTKGLVAGLDAVGEAYQATLRGFYGLLLDNTKELRKALEDGNAVIDTINELRGAECEEASFTPPEAQPARLTGAAGTFTISTGDCSLRRAATPLQLDYVLTCNAPAVQLETQAPRYTSRFVSAAAATTEECKVTRRYGVESTTTITLFDPAEFVAAAEEEEEPAAEAQAGRMANATEGLNKGATWYKAMFPALRKDGRSFTFVPSGIVEAVAAAIKEATIEMEFEYKPFSLRKDMQDTADALARKLGQTLQVTNSVRKAHRNAAERWLDPVKRAEMMQGLNFKDNLQKAAAGANMSELFDGIFAQTAGKLLGGVLGKGHGAAGGLAEQLASERPLRTLLAKARQGAGEPISFKLKAKLDEVIDAAGDTAGAVTEGIGAAFQGLLGGQAGGLADMLSRDPLLGGKLKQLADALGAASAAATAAIQAPRAQIG